MDELIDQTQQALSEAIAQMNYQAIDTLTRLLATLYSYKLQASTNNKG